MIDVHDKLYKDFEAVKKIPITATMLEVVCRATGMRFAAIARVTEDRWLACVVRDEIEFGLEAGGELKVETTICDEIRDNRQAVIIDHVAEDDNFAEHHTPKMYGFQSYISFPILLKNGDFFGTLCAIDPKPADLHNPKILGMFTMFAELLSFHLQSIDLVEQSHLALKETKRQLHYSQDEVRQYEQVSHHNLQEPLRKISMFSDILLNNTENDDVAGAKKAAVKIHSFAKEVTKMIRDIAAFSVLTSENTPFEKTDLSKQLQNACDDLAPRISERKIVIESEPLPVISAIASQMEQLFFHLVNTLITFAHQEHASVIRIHSKELALHDIKDAIPAAGKYCELLIEDKNLVIEKRRLESMFDMFVRSSNSDTEEGYDAALVYCRKIVYHHGGSLSIRSTEKDGTLFSIILPVDRK